jgi:two-component system sensor histidine kinase KdpD
MISDPKDWLSLFAFLIVGIAAGLQTGRMRDREAEALAREQEMVLLNRFSIHLVSDTTISDMADALIKEVEQVSNSQCVMLLLADEEGKLQNAGKSANINELDSTIRSIAEWVRRESKAAGLPTPSMKSESTGGEWPISVKFSNIGFSDDRRDIFIPLQTASHLGGVLYIGERIDNQYYSAREARLMIAVANQAAAFIERKRLQTLAIQADALREADKLKSTFVSSVSHELKTPLASITATISNLLEQDVDWSTEHMQQELEAVQDDLIRLNNSINALLDLSRLESAAWEPHKELFEFGEILGTAIGRIPQKQRGRISFDLPDDLPMICVDFMQWTRVLENLLRNALAYSPDGSPVRVFASTMNDETRIWVEDSGPGIMPEDRGRIFDKFYRGKTSAGIQSGTGLGLAVTHEIIRFHGGRIWVEDVVPHGARMVISLPKEKIMK